MGTANKVEPLTGVKRNALGTAVHGHGVGLAQAQTGCPWSIERGNRRGNNRCARSHWRRRVLRSVDSVAGAGEPGKQLRSPNLCLELNVEGQIGKSVVIVIDLDLVKNVGIEGKEIGPVAGFEEGIHIHDECDPIGMVVTDKRVEVCDVCCVV